MDNLLIKATRNKAFCIVKVWKKCLICSYYKPLLWHTSALFNLWMKLHGKHLIVSLSLSLELKGKTNTQCFCSWLMKSPTLCVCVCVCVCLLRLNDSPHWFCFHPFCHELIQKQTNVHSLSSSVMTLIHWGTNMKFLTHFWSFPFCRAPVLVALALIECGMKYEDAVQFIRQ